KSNKAGYAKCWPNNRPDPADTPLYAVYPHQKHLPAKVRVFVDFLAERFGRETDWAGGR
ncbi:MAG: hypothetical protein IIA35_07560, partial [Proteobacteria bacterium]|nr:hypothetical protein [Pseudomonadota bacterium]